MNFRFHACADQVVIVTDRATKASRAVGLKELAKAIDDPMTRNPWGEEVSICFALCDPCTLILENGIETEAEHLSEQAKRERAQRRKDKLATERERWATKYGAKA